MKALILCFLLYGCGTFMEKKETFVACRAIDVVSTISILEQGGRELNPLMARILSHGYIPFIALQATVTWFITKHWDTRAPESNVVLNAVGCFPAIHNLGQL